VREPKVRPKAADNPTMSVPAQPSRARTTAPARGQRAFTLVELVVVIVVLGVLAAYAVPRFVGMDANARAASVNALAGALRATSVQVRGLCMTTAATSGCDTTSASWTGTINGKGYWLNYGYPDAGDEIAGRQIDGMIDYSGFRAFIVGNPSTRFVRDDAPNPDRCSVEFFDAYYTPPAPHLVVLTDGC
jgi:MSHA pilin protein MshA